jgi:hypothetical protein
MAKDLRFEEAIAILKARDFEMLVGVVEGDDIEAKSEPYQLTKDHTKQELAKDVVAFANTKGGVIILGAKTKRDPVHFGDEIEVIRPFERRLLNPSQYNDILNTWVYPALRKVEVIWFPMKGDEGNGIGAIIIPEQDVNRRPFLVTRTLDESGKRVDLVFGYAERKLASVSSMSFQELQGIMRDGMRFDLLNQKMDSIQGTIERFLEAAECDGGHILNCELSSALECRPHGANLDYLLKDLR